MSARRALAVPCAVALLVLAGCPQTVTVPRNAADGGPTRGDDDATARDDAGADDATPARDAEVPPDAACTPQCGARRCGVDPVCGESCGTCETDQACSAQGECIASCAAGSVSCLADGASYQGCGFDELLGVDGLGPRIACATGARCVADRCVGGACNRAQVMLVVDRSASIGANNTWSWMRDELLAAVGSYQNDVSFGLRQFPEQQCLPSAPSVPVRDAQRTLNTQLLMPGADATSPIADALSGLAGSLSGQDDGKAVILLTDGDETCRTPEDAVRAASILRRAGVRVYPIAIGSSANNVLLEQIALAGGTGSARMATTALSLRAALGEVMGDLNACKNAHAQVALGWYHTCGIRGDGRLACWGRADEGRSAPPTGRFTAIGASTDAACAVALDGRVQCWGRNLNGQLSPPGGVFVEVSGGDSHFCGRKLDDTVVCWGNDDQMQRTVPAGTYKQVSATAFGACAIQQDDTMRCWAGTAPLSGTFRFIEGGSFSLCGIHTDGTVECRGFTGQPTPSGTFTQVAAGHDTACGLRTDGTIACWGSDIYDLITDVPPGRFVQVDVQYMTACAVRDDDRILCWGYNDEGMASPPP